MKHIEQAPPLAAALSALSVHTRYELCIERHTAAYLHANAESV